MTFGARKLPFADHVHRLDPGSENARRTALAFESQHGGHNSLDAPVFLLNDVVEASVLVSDDI